MRSCHGVGSDRATVLIACREVLEVSTPEEITLLITLSDLLSLGLEIINFRSLNVIWPPLRISELTEK